MKNFLSVAATSLMLGFGSTASAIGPGLPYTPAEIKVAIQDRIDDLQDEIADLNAQLAALAAGQQTPSAIAQQAQLNDEIETITVLVGQLDMASQQGFAKLYGAVTQFNLNVSPHSP